MKVVFTKIICSLFCTALLMTSCLGDGDSSYSIDRAFAYITEVNGLRCASTDIGYIRTANGNEMSNLTVGQCYYISYKVTTTQPSNGILAAEYINILDDGEPIPQTRLFEGDPYSNLGESKADSIHINSMELIKYYPAFEVFGDRWAIKYSVPSVKDEDDVVAYFYFDENNQVDENKEPIGFSTNKIVVDVRFIKREGNGSGSTKTKDYVSVGNVYPLRSSEYVPKYDSNGVARVAVKLRYITPASGDTPATVKYYPTGTSAWNGDGNYAYFLYYNQNQN